MDVDIVQYTREALDGAARDEQMRQAYGDDAYKARLPDTIAGDTLDLSHRHCKSLPIEVIHLIKDRVERLALGHNLGCSIPPEITLCKRLRYLNIRCNGLREFPEAVLGLSHLEILDISKNKITALPDNINRMTSLKFLGLTQNRVTRLPVSMGEMQSLARLKFDDNPLEFPPREVYTLPSAPSSPAYDPIKYVCTEVKKFLREFAKEQAKAAAEDDTSESNAETPRPARRTIGGRFPVRPSISGIEGLGDLKLDSARMPPPPIPQRSQARDSIINFPSNRRPGLAPLLTEGERNRSRSETVTSTASNSSHRSKRLGYVPRKTSDAASFTDTGTLKPKHFHGASHASVISILQTSSGGETSSGPGSPVDGPTSRSAISSRRLSSLPEARRASKSGHPVVKLARRIVFSLYQLNAPIDNVLRAIRGGTPKKSIAERAHFAAMAQVDELDRLLHRLADRTEEDNDAYEDINSIKALLRKSIHCMRSYGQVATELRLNARKIVFRGEPMYIRSMMLQVYGSLVEIRNALSVLEDSILDKTPVRTQRTSRAMSSRSVTPTQAKPLTNRRIRGATILQPGGIDNVQPPVPLISGTNSRTGTMTSISTATPTSAHGESFSGLVSAPMSRSNTMQSHVDEMDDERQFERIYLKLQNACTMAEQILPNCRTDIAMRKEGAARSMNVNVTHMWTIAYQKSEAALNALQSLKEHLSVVKLKDPALRSQQDFWRLCDTFVRSYTDLATEIKIIGSHGHDVRNIKINMRPAHKAVKDVGIAIQGSPLYHNALRLNINGNGTSVGGTISPSGSISPYATSMQANYIQPFGMNPPGSGYVTPVPATPLSAALGPAAQATVPSTPGLTPGLTPVEYFAQELRRDPETTGSGRERSDTMGSRMYGRRGDSSVR